MIAVDVQPKMLGRLTRRAAKAGLSDRIDVRLPKGDRLGIDDYAGRVDFVLAFAMVHEVPNSLALFADIHSALKPGGILLFAEPAGHVSADGFESSLAQAKESGMAVESRPVIRRSHAAMLVRA